MFPPSWYLLGWDGAARTAFVALLALGWLSGRLLPARRSTLPLAIAAATLLLFTLIAHVDAAITLDADPSRGFAAFPPGTGRLAIPLARPVTYAGALVAGLAGALLPRHDATRLSRGLAFAAFAAGAYASWVGPWGGEVAFD